MNMQVSQFDDQGRYVFRSFDQARPFSSFLPGIGGLFGIPMWVFYTNRGQGITSFGIRSKDQPIMEFQPANKAYRFTASSGFRTFLRGDDWFIEPFSPWNKSNPQRDMHIGMNEFEIKETDFERGLETRVLYYNIVNENFAALVRSITLRNLGNIPLAFDVLDGMPILTPYGVDNDMLKSIGRTIEAWMKVDNVQSGIPIFRLKASAGDSSEVNAIEGGFFALGIINNNLVPPIVDPAIIFETDTALSFPEGLNKGLSHLYKTRQILEGRTPCAFFGGAITLQPGQAQTISSLYGFSSNSIDVPQLRSKFLDKDYLPNKREEAREIIQDLTNPIATQSANPLFDAFARQSFLDNVLRGGWPKILSDKHVYHVYSRKHGDPERDYNDFYFSPEYYSQGNGNYRDVNQNRRNDLFFEPRVGDFNIRTFMSLIQTDGYNPLVVKGIKFTVSEVDKEEILSLANPTEKLARILTGAFSPGELIHAATQSKLAIPPQDFLDIVLEKAQPHIQAEFGEGFWVDHWFYNLDLIDSYLTIFPEKFSDLLFDSEPLAFFDSPVVVNPRKRKYVLENSSPRQYNAIIHDEEKSNLINSRKEHPNWVRADFGTGDIFRVSLFTKLVMLAVIKFSTLDPFGMGIEMEAGRPGWCDALNGLPSLFGSSLSETFALVRLIDFILEALDKEPRDINVPVELNNLLDQVLIGIEDAANQFQYWDFVSSAREAYRQQTRLGVSGKMTRLSATFLGSAFEKMMAKLKAGIDRAMEDETDIPPTYFSCQLSDFEISAEKDEMGRPFILPRSFSQNRLPLYLEAPVHFLKIIKDSNRAETLYQKVRQSELFDKKIGMYKLNTSLKKETFEIGRARAFSPGWLENESIWLHMSYKYLLEMLNAGLYEEFFEDILTNLPPYMEPDVYGRSPLENSSFIVSSAHPDPSIHGTGFVARLTGSTAEILSIWQLITSGRQPFKVNREGDLLLQLQPILPGWFFTEEATFSFRFLGHTAVTYHNPEKKDTYDSDATIQEYVLRFKNDSEMTVKGDHIPAPYAEDIRNGNITEINAFFH